MNISYDNSKPTFIMESNENISSAHGPMMNNGTQKYNGIDTRDRLIPNEIMHDITVYVSIAFPILISFIGTVSNVFNLIIFMRLGIKDGMTIGLWALSFSDLMVAFQTLGSSLCYTANLLAPGATIDPILVQYVSLCWSQDMFYLISTWITTYISLERCVCVVFPFKVKYVFTKGRYLLAILFIYAFHVVSYLPIFATHWLSMDPKEPPSQPPLHNSTSSGRLVMTVHYGSDRAVIHHAVDIMNGAVLPVVQQALVIGSAAILASGLKESSKIRQGPVSSQKDGTKRKSGLTTKESRLITVVIFLAIILTFCNIPRFVAVYATLLIPEMAIGRLYENVYVFLWALTAMFASLNASVNIFVYLLVNVSFRTIFVSMMCPFSKDASSKVANTKLSL